jgi:hypothetical protein
VNAPLKLDTRLKKTAEAYAYSIANGTAREIACFGARGDGKSWAALWGIVLHAIEHQQRGFPLPTVWLAVRDTLANHKQTTQKTLLGAEWEGRWRISDGGHRARFVLDGETFVQLEMIGADSEADAEKVRTECHGVWMDEAAPAMMHSSGLSDTIWFQAMASQRLATHAWVGALTTNMPDEEHWTWKRFHVDPQPGTLKFQIPSGERATPEYQDTLRRMYAGRPDLLRRLVLGLPGAVLLGRPVATDFREDLHVAPRRIVPERSAPLWLGVDGGKSYCWTTVIGQRVHGRLNVLAALCDDESGALQHFQQTVIPWLGEHVPWALNGGELHVRYDPSCDTEDPGDRESNPLRTMRAVLPGHYRPGPQTWPGRLNPLHALLNQLRGGNAVLQIDPVCTGLIRALRGGWHYPTKVTGAVKSDVPAKPNHPHEDYGDAFCYLVAGAQALSDGRPAPKPYHARTAFNPVTHGQARRPPLLRTTPFA